MPFISNRTLAIICCLIFWGCRDEFIYEPGNPDPVMVVEGHIQSGREVAFYLRESAPAFSSSSLDRSVNGAIARLYVNGTLYGIVPQTSDGFYRQNVDLKKGDQVELVIRKDGFPLVTCADEIPSEIEIIGIDSTRTIGETLGMRIRFRDPDISNYYELHVNMLVYEYTEFDGEIPTDSALVMLPAIFSSSNKIFFAENNLLRTIPGFHLFNDQFIDDEVYDLEIGVNLNQTETGRSLTKPRAIILNFRNISESHYNTLSGLLLNNSVYGGPFSHSSNVEDNIQGGFGLMEYYWEETDTFSLIP